VPAEKKRRSGFSVQWVPSFLILVAMVLITAFLQDNLLTQRGLINIVNSYFPLVLMTIGQTAVLISGCIDLSSGAALSLISCVLASTMQAGDPVSGWVAIGLAAAMALATALMNGFIVGIRRVPPVIATYATSFIYLGAALFILPRPGGECTNWVTGFYRFSSVDGAPQWLQTLGGYLPPIAIVTLLMLLIWSFMRRTRFGRYLYATGSNETSAYFSGIPTARVRMGAYLFNALCILLTAIFFVAQNQTADYQFGDAYTLKSIAAAVIGGVAMTGGRGSAVGALIGALILSFVNKIIFFSGLPNAYQTLVNGVIVIASLLVSYLYTFANRRIKERKG